MVVLINEALMVDLAEDHHKNTPAVIMTKMMANAKFTAFNNQGGPTFYAPSGATSTPDYIIGPPTKHRVGTTMAHNGE